jgi:hypothetical protein
MIGRRLVSSQEPENFILIRVCVSHILPPIYVYSMVCIATTTQYIGKVQTGRESWNLSTVSLRFWHSLRLVPGTLLGSRAYVGITPHIQYTYWPKHSQQHLDWCKDNLTKNYDAQRDKIQGGEVNRGLKCFFFFFSVYRPSCLLEAYVRPEKYWLVCIGPLANHLFNLNFIFRSDGGRNRVMFCEYIYHC